MSPRSLPPTTSLRWSMWPSLHALTTVDPQPQLVRAQCFELAATQRVLFFRERGIHAAVYWRPDSVFTFPEADSP
jgi:hypothetical protein